MSGLKDIINFDPLPEDAEDELLEKLADLLENGGKIPAEPSMAMIFALGVKNHRQNTSTRNQVRKHMISLRLLWLGFIGLIAVAADYLGIVNIFDAIK